MNPDGRPKYGSLHMTDENLIAHAIASAFGQNVSHSYIANADVLLTIKIKSMIDRLWIDPDKQKTRVIHPFDSTEIHYCKMREEKISKLRAIINL